MSSVPLPTAPIDSRAISESQLLTNLQIKVWGFLKAPMTVQELSIAAWANSVVVEKTVSQLLSLGLVVKDERRLCNQCRLVKQSYRATVPNAEGQP